MAVNIDSEIIFNRFFNRLNSRFTKFDYFSRIGNDNVIVLFVEVRFFVMSLVLRELVFSNQSAFHMYFNGVIQSSLVLKFVLDFIFTLQFLYIIMHISFIVF